MQSTYTSFSEFHNWLMVEKKHNWSPKVTSAHMNKVVDANQIQYKIIPREDGRVDVQATNILDNDNDSLDPEVVDSQHLDVLKIFIGKKWLLAETHPLAQEKLAGEKYARFCAYILYHDMIMDHFLSKQDDILKFWFVLESTNGGRHHRFGNGNGTGTSTGSGSGSGFAPSIGGNVVVDKHFDMDLAFEQVISSWHIHTLCLNDGNVRRISEKKLSRMKDRLLNWFMEEAEADTDVPRETSQKRSRTVRRDNKTKKGHQDKKDEAAGDSDRESTSERGRKRKRSLINKEKTETNLRSGEHTRSSSVSSIKSITMSELMEGGSSDFEIDIVKYRKAMGFDLDSELTTRWTVKS